MAFRRFRLVLRLRETPMKLLRTSWLAQPIAAIVVSALVTVQTGAIALAADPIASGAAAGRAVGGSIPNVNDLFSAQPNGQVTLWPNSSKPLSLSSGDMFPGSSGQNADTTQALYGNDNAMRDAGTEAHKRLKTEESRTGEAYRTLVGSANVTRPNLDNDPLWAKSDFTWNNLPADFQDCKSSTTFSKGSFAAHIPDYKTCERITDESRNCTLQHTYKAGIINHKSGPLNLASCGDGCLYIWIGTVGDNYWQGNCTIFEEAIEVDVFNPDAVISATVDYAKWDDYMQILMKGQKVWSGPDSNFPPETVGNCENGVSWQRNLSVDVTSYFKTKGPLEFRTRTSVTGKGEGYARLKVIYDPKKVLAVDEYSPPDCERSTKGLADKFCKGTYQCLDMPTLDADGCAVIDGIKLCESDMVPIHPGLSPMCRKASINATCDFYKGQMDCWVDAQGQQQCPKTSGENMASCASYEANPACGFIKSSCVQGAQGTSGACYVMEEQWDCGHSATVPTVTRSTETSCPGPIRCMGTDCVNPQAELSDDFARAAATLSAARFMAMDAECNEDTIEANRNCTVFKGKAQSCKKAVGGIVDCCASTSTVSLGDYISLILAVGKLDSAVSALDKSNAIRGAYETLTGPIDSAWTELNKPFVQGWENIWGGTESVASDAASKTLIGSIQQTLLNKVGDWTAQVFGDAAANSLFSVAETGGSAFVGGTAQGPLQLGGGQAIIGSVLGWVMIAYTVYQIVMILIKIIWACEKEEFELNAQKQLKNCHQVGSYCNSKVAGVCIEKRESYCCFNSPLSRIIQEQVRPQIGLSWGTPKDPDCRGITTDEIQLVDWSKVNLDEWLGLLAETGHLPTDSNVSVEKLTGAGSSLNVGTRMDSSQRAKERIGGINVDKARKDATTELKSRPLPGN
ncbi:conjugal transfer protein TraN [Azospirillum oryzae]|nr:conjugal transfer protein TraN [Azospirillum oryzae]